MKENYQIYLLYQFHWRPHSLNRDPQLPHKKMKTLFLEYVKKSKTDFDFFPDKLLSQENFVVISDFSLSFFSQALSLKFHGEDVKCKEREAFQKEQNREW